MLLLGQVLICIFASSTEGDGRLCFHWHRYVGYRNIYLYGYVCLWTSFWLQFKSDCQSYPWPQGKRWLNFGRSRSVGRYALHWTPLWLFIYFSIFSNQHWLLFTVVYRCQFYDTFDINESRYTTVGIVRMMMRMMITTAAAAAAAALILFMMLSSWESYCECLPGSLFVDGSNIRVSVITCQTLMSLTRASESSGIRRLLS